MKVKTDSKMWFDYTDAKMIAGAVKEHVDGITNDNAERNDQWRRWYRQYRDPKMSSLVLNSSTQLSSKLLNLFRTPLTLNIAQSIPDAFLSKIGKYRERMMFTVQNSRRSSAREQARLLQQYDVGIKHETGMYDTISPSVKLDSMIYGTGYYNTFWEHGKPQHEHVHAPEIHVDPAEGMNRKPQNIYRTMFLDRRVVMHAFPKKAEEIMGLAEGLDGGADLWWRERFEGSGDVVMVTQATHLPSGPGAGDGRVSVSIGDILLNDPKAAWKYDWHQYTPIRFIEAPDGWDGIGIVEKVSGIQYELNRMVRSIQSAHMMLGHPFIFADKRAALNPGHLRGISATVINYLQHKPSIETPQTVNPEIYKHMIWLIGYAAEHVGLPAADAAGMPHPGMESARAELVAGEKTSDRFTMYQRQCERAMKEATEKQFAYCAENNYKVKSFHRSQLQDLAWKDIKTSIDEFIIRPMPASIMPDTPDGQLERIEQLRNSGIVTELDDQYELMGDFPDMSEFMDRQLSMRRYLVASIGKILETGEFEPPMPEIDTKQAMVIATQMYTDAYVEGVDEKNLAKVTLWMEYVRKLETDRNPPPPMMSEQDMMMQAQGAEQMGAMTGAPPPGMLPPVGVPTMTPEAGGAVAPPPAENQIAAMMGGMPPGGMPNA